MVPPSALTDLGGEICSKDPLDARDVVLEPEEKEPPSALVDLIGDMIDEVVVEYMDGVLGEGDRDGGFGPLSFLLTPRPSSLAV